MSATRASDASLVLIPGMGADARLFEDQRAAFPQLIVPRWIAPIRNEGLQAYAERFAREVDLPKHCVLGGASFGGFVALELARHVNPRAVILIGSLRGPHELPRHLRAVKPLSNCLGLVPFEILQRVAQSSASFSPLVEQYAATDPAFIRWACGAVLSWSTAPPTTAPIFQIHGQRDPILPASCTKPDEIVPGAGHVLSLTHPCEVNAFIRRVLNDVVTGRAGTDRAARRPA